jgi:hypothetical protein
MKNQIVKTLVQIGLVAIIAAISGVITADGQSLSNRVGATIPFDFTVADKKLPAGEYYIGRGQPSSGDTLLRVSSVGGNQNSFRLTIPVVTSAPKDSDTLIFHQYGDQYFLSEVWPAGASVGRVLLESRGERAARASVGSNKLSMKVRTVSATGGSQ